MIILKSKRGERSGTSANGDASNAGVIERTSCLLDALTELAAKVVRGGARIIFIEDCVTSRK